MRRLLVALDSAPLSQGRRIEPAACQARPERDATCALTATRGSACIRAILLCLAANVAATACEVAQRLLPRADSKGAGVAARPAT